MPEKGQGNLDLATGESEGNLSNIAATGSLAGTPDAHKAARQI